MCEALLFRLGASPLSRFSLFTRRIDDDMGRTHELEHSAVKCMRGILYCYMRQADKVSFSHPSISFCFQSARRPPASLGRRGRAAASVSSSLSSLHEQIIANGRRPGHGGRLRNRETRRTSRMNHQRRAGAFAACAPASTLTA